MNVKRNRRRVPNHRRAGVTGQWELDLVRVDNSARRLIVLTESYSRTVSFKPTEGSA